MWNILIVICITENCIWHTCVILWRYADRAASQYIYLSN